MGEMIPLMRPSIDESDIEAVAKQLKSGSLTGGTKVREFEKAFAEYVGAPYCVAVDTLTNGFVALIDMLSPSMANIPTATFISIANTLKKFNIPIQFRDGWIAGKEYEIFTDKGVIMDSAHALDRKICLKDKNAIWMFSFHSTKLLATGRGGMIAFFSEEQANFFRMLINNSRIYANNTFEYTVHIPGWNFYMSDIEAALGISQLEKLDETNRKRDEVKKLYDKYLVPDKKDSWSRYVYQVWIENFSAFYKECQKEKIQVSKHFNPIHLQPAFALPVGRFPQAERASQCMISIPFWANMSEEQVKEVSRLINQWRNNEKS